MVTSRRITRQKQKVPRKSDWFFIYVFRPSKKTKKLHQSFGKTEASCQKQWLDRMGSSTLFKCLHPHIKLFQRPILITIFVFFFSSKRNEHHPPPPPPPPGPSLLLMIMILWMMMMMAMMKDLALFTLSSSFLLSSPPFHSLSFAHI